jgi:uncharacterized membrane protein
MNLSHITDTPINLLITFLLVIGMSLLILFMIGWAVVDIFVPENSKYKLR